MIILNNKLSITLQRGVCLLLLCVSMVATAKTPVQFKTIPQSIKLDLLGHYGTYDVAVSDKIRVDMSRDNCDDILASNIPLTVKMDLPESNAMSVYFLEASPGLVAQYQWPDAGMHQRISMRLNMSQGISTVMVVVHSQGRLYYQQVPFKRYVCCYPG